MAPVLSEPYPVDQQLQAIQSNSSMYIPEIKRVEKESSHWQRGVSLTRNVQHRGLRVDYQEGPDGANWTLLSADQNRILEGVFNISTGPIVMVDRFDRAGAGMGVTLDLGNTISVYHSSQFGSLEQHFSTFTVAPKAPVGLELSRFASAGADTLTRLGPVVNLGSTTKVSYGRGLNGSSDLLFVTSNLRF